MTLVVLVDLIEDVAGKGGLECAGQRIVFGIDRTPHVGDHRLLQRFELLPQHGQLGLGRGQTLNRLVAQRQRPLRLPHQVADVRPRRPRDGARFVRQRSQPLGMVRDPRWNRQRYVPGDHPRGIGRGQSKAIADQPGDLARQSGIATGEMDQRQPVMWDGRLQPLMF